MPKGVEHFTINCIGQFIKRGAKGSVMPKGVEHGEFDLRVWIETWAKGSVMPKGVEHSLVPETGIAVAGRKDP